MSLITGGLARLALAAILTVALLTPLLTGCAGEEDDAYRIGALFAVTGFNSPLGTPAKETAEMIEKQINDAGGINGRPINVIIYDTESDETRAVTLTKQLIEQDKVLAIIGPSSTGESLALVDTIETAKVPLVSAAASARIVVPVKKWVFKTPQSDSLAVAELYDYMRARGIDRIGILTSSGGFGVTGKEALEVAAPDAGIQIVAAETFGDRDTDMTVQLTKMKGAEPQAVVVWGTNPGPAIIARNMRQLQMDIPLFNSHGVASAKFIELAGDAANGVIFPAGKLLVADKLLDDDPQKAVLIDYKRSFEEKYGKPADTFGGHTYDALWIVVNAIEKVGDDRAKIRDEIENTRGFVGTGGIFSMSPEDHNGLGRGAFVMIQVVDGEWEMAE